MVWRLTLAALATVVMMQGPALAQSDQDSAKQDNPQQDGAKNVPNQIRQKLAEKGFKDIKIVPGSYLVSAKDKNGSPIMMLIGPGHMTVLSAAPENGDDPSIAQTPDQKKGDEKNELYQE